MSETSSPVQFNPGETTKLLRFQIMDDMMPEPSEWFQVELTSGMGVTIGDGVGRCTILDND